MYKSFFVFLILIIQFLSPVIYGQTGVIKGSVRDALTKETIQNATLVLVSDKEETIHKSTRSGDYKIEKIPAGSYTLKVLYVGYSDKIIRLSVKDDTTIININLSTPRDTTYHFPFNGKLMGEFKYDSKEGISFVFETDPHWLYSDGTRICYEKEVTENEILFDFKQLEQHRGMLHTLGMGGVSSRITLGNLAEGKYHLRIKVGSRKSR